MSLEEATISNM
jgi:hypothetical protein